MPNPRGPVIKGGGGGYCHAPCPHAPLTGADWLYLLCVGAGVLVAALTVLAVVALGWAMGEHDSQG